MAATDPVGTATISITFSYELDEPRPTQAAFTSAVKEGDLKAAAEAMIVGLGGTTTDKIQITFS